MRDVELGDLVLRIPGISEDDARWIAARVATRLADGVAAWADDDRPSLTSLRVTIPTDAGREVIAAEIAAAVARSLRHG